MPDGLPALALAVDPSDPDLMRRPPRSPQEPFLPRHRLLLLGGQGLLIAASTLAAFLICLYTMGPDLPEARTVAFTVLVLAQLFHALNCRSDRLSLFTLRIRINKPLLYAAGGFALLQVGILANPWTQGVFNVVPLALSHWLLVIGLGVLPLPVMEGWKVVLRWNESRARLG